MIVLGQPRILDRWFGRKIGVFLALFRQQLIIGFQLQQTS